MSYLCLNTIDTLAIGFQSIHCPHFVLIILFFMHFCFLLLFILVSLDTHANRIIIYWYWKLNGGFFLFKILKALLYVRIIKQILKLIIIVWECVCLCVLWGVYVLGWVLYVCMFVANHRKSRWIPISVSKT